MNRGFTLWGEKTPDGFAINRQRFAQMLSELPNGQYEVTVVRFIETRSKKQNAYYHAVIVKGLAEYWGLDPEDAHELIKKHCNSKIVDVVNKETGEVGEETIPCSTASLNKEEWGLFIERVQRWAAIEFDFVIPDPDPEWMFKSTSTV